MATTFTKLPGVQDKLAAARAQGFEPGEMRSDEEYTTPTMSFQKAERGFFITSKYSVLGSGSAVPFDPDLPTRWDTDYIPDTDALLARFTKA
jgi:hypothetical protein